MDGAPPVLPRESSLNRVCLNRASLNRASLNRAPLVQLLAGLGMAPAAPSPLSLAERWSPWLAWTDAIALSSVLATGAAAQTRAVDPDPAVGRRSEAARAIADSLGVRQALAQAILDDPALQAPQNDPQPAGLPPADALADAQAPAQADAHATLRRRHRQHQQALETAVATQRARLRAVMPALGPALARLASLDAVLEPALASRQRAVLAALPDRLGHAPGQVRAALLAELDLRWQPVAGLLEAVQAAPTSAVEGRCA